MKPTRAITNHALTYIIEEVIEGSHNSHCNEIVLTDPTAFLYCVHVAIGNM